MDHLEATPTPGLSVAITIMTTLLNTTLEDYPLPCLDSCNASAPASSATDADTHSSNETEKYCTSRGWTVFRESYQPVHGCMSLVVCVFGSVANVINMVVLTRRSMVSPTNAILTGLAVTDLLVMVEYIPYTMHQYVWKWSSLTARFSWGWAVFILFHAHFGQVFHTISIGLTVTLAVWRYIAIAFPQNNASWCSMPRTLRVIVAAFFCSLICNIPNYLNFTIVQFEYKGETLYRVDLSRLALAHGEILKNITFWIYSVILKLLPCAALTGLSVAIIKELLRTARRRAKLMNSSGRANDAEKVADRVTKMLLVILVLFLASEVPQGILSLLTVILGSEFFPCYRNLGETMDMLVLLNSAINFLLYCAMSKQFRDTFSELFKPCCTPVLSVRKKRFLPSWMTGTFTDPGTESNNTCITHV